MTGLRTPELTRTPELVRAVPPILIAALGNDALRDDGVGLHVARALAAISLPAGVHVWEAGIAAWALLGRLDGVHKLVLVDAMAMSRPPGTVVAVAPHELRRLTAPDRASLHGTTLPDVLELAAALGLQPPETIIVGIQPAEVGMGFGLSPQVAAALPAAVEAVLRAIADQPPGRSAQVPAQGQTPAPAG